jgi:filamentous hemagglutinin family protein
MNVISGQASTSLAGQALTVVSSNGAVLNWQGFSIGSGGSVVFQQPNANSQVLNRVTGQDPSTILGSLQSNGRVWLLNPNGVLFGSGARIDVGGLVASTLDMTNSDFANGRYVMKSGSTVPGSVVNQGRITTPYGGQVFLVGSQVHNSGSIQSAGGQIALLSTSQVELVDNGTPFVSVRVPVLDGRVLQTGSVAAQHIDIHGAAVNQDGSLLADSLQTDANGQIVLRASGPIGLGSSSLTSAPGGGIKVESSAGTVQIDGRVDVSVQRGEAGQIAVQAMAIAAGANGQLRADAKELGNGGNISLKAVGNTQVLGAISARGGASAGDGGLVETSSQGSLDLRATPDASAPQGRPGTWLIDPYDIVIVAGSGVSNASGSTPFTASGNTATLGADLITTALNAGTSVSVNTAGAAVGAQAGDITVAANIAATTPKSGIAPTLSFNAWGNVNVNGHIDANLSGGALNVALNANQGAGSSQSNISGGLQLNGGALTLGAPAVLLGTGSVLGGVVNIPAGTSLSVQDSGVVITTVALNVGGLLSLQGGVLSSDGAINVTGGTIDVQSSFKNWEGSGPLVNSGLMNLSNLTIKNAVTNNGAINSSGGLLFTQPFTNQGIFNQINNFFSTGTYNFAAGITQNSGEVRASGLAVRLGNIAAAPATSTRLSVSAAVSPSITVVNNGKLIVGGSGLVLNGGTLSGFSDVTGSVTINAGATVSLDFFGGSTIKSGDVWHLAGGTLTTSTLGVAGTLNVSAGTLNAGSATVASGAAVNLSGGTANVSGTLDVSGGGTLKQTAGFLNASALNVGGAMTVALGGLNLGPSAVFNGGALNINGGLVAFSSTLDVQAGGALTHASTGRTTVAGVTTNAGNVVLDSSPFSLDGGYTQTTGSTTLGGTATGPGNLTTGGAGFQLNGGTLRGSGVIAGNVSVGAATLEPGFSPGSLSIVGNLQLGAASTLAIEVGGVQPGIGYDAITVSGSAALNGTLNVMSFGAFTPAAAHRFNYLNYGSSTGALAAVNYLGAASAWGLTNSAQASGLQLGAVIPLTPFDVAATTSATGLIVGSTPLWPGFALTGGVEPAAAAPLGSFATPAAGLAADSSSVVAAQASGLARSKGYAGAAASILDLTDTTGLAGGALTAASLGNPGGTTAPGRAFTPNGLPAHRFLVSDPLSSYFRVLPLADMTSAEVTQILASRKSYKKALFATAIALLEADPSLPDLGDCTAGGAALAACLYRPAAETRPSSQGNAGPLSPPKPGDARAPMGARRAVVVGINQYEDKRIPQLIGAVPDAHAVAQMLHKQLGYQVTVIRDGTKQAISLALNRLASESRAGDSVLVYYAGHGEMVDSTGFGYWIPSDANANKPETWFSNADLNRLLARLPSKQITVISDSCYSGRFALEGGVDGSASGAGIEDLLQRRAVTMMTSGGDEPVADTGKEGHSVFSWSLVEELKRMQGWERGSRVFEGVRVAVERELPQAPQYGASLSAGHESGADFLFEKRLKSASR